ncbi:MAG TPA: hypothetical protein VKI65_17600, partial [Gemmataceae bacterium]|nr:hypothetical protein [Gemmataceae bacterium]
MIRTCLRCVLGLVFVASVAMAADKPAEKKPGDAMIEKYLAQETDKISKKELDSAKTIEEWQKKRPRLKQEYLDMLGL